MPYLDKSNMVILRYGKNDPPVLVLFLSTIKNQLLFLAQLIPQFQHH